MNTNCEVLRQVIPPIVNRFIRKFLNKIYLFWLVGGVGLKIAHPPDFNKFKATKKLLAKIIQILAYEQPNKNTSINNLCVAGVNLVFIS